MLVAAGRIKVDEVHRTHLPEVFHAVAAHDARLVESQCGHIVFGQIAQMPLPFHISGLAESGAPDTKSPRRIRPSDPPSPFSPPMVSDSGESDNWNALFAVCMTDSAESDTLGAHGCGRREQGLCDF